MLTVDPLLARGTRDERALRLHQNLLARPDLDEKSRDEVTYELAQDYFKAGLLDQAEELLTGLCGKGRFVEHSLKMLQGIYEQIQEWEKAIDVAERLETLLGKSFKSVIAHYYCELAQSASRDSDTAKANKFAKKALKTDSASVRASMLLGSLAEKADDPKLVIKSLQRVPDQNIKFFDEVLPKLRAAYEKIQDLDGFQEYLAEAAEHYDSASARLELARLQQDQGGDSAQHFLKIVSEQPTWRGLHHLLEQIQGLGEPVQILHKAIGQSIAEKPKYHCANCGMTPKMLFWQCPGCKTWGSIEPLSDAIRKQATR